MEIKLGKFKVVTKKSVSGEESDNRVVGFPVITDAKVQP